MNSIPFTLVSSEAPNEIYAVGLEIVRDGDDIEAVTYRRDPRSGHTLFGVHASAEAACGRYSMVTPLTLRWQHENPDPGMPGN